MPQALDALWEPIELGSLTLRNRVMAGPATLLYADDNVLSERHIAFYRERAAGGAGVIVSEEHAAHPTALGAFRHACTAWEPRAVGPFTRLAEAVHEHGGRQLIQLYAPGLADSSTLNLDDWGPVWAPSAIVAPDGERSVAMAQADIESMVAGFVTSASNVAAAGLDGVELHGAHGWLIGQFLSPMFNRRTDAYGGSTEARCRLALEIAQAVRDHRPGLVLGLQLSVDEYVGDVGITPEETDLQVEILAGSGLFDYLSLSTGSQFSRHRTIPPIGTPDAVLAEHGRRAREIARGRAAIALLGRIRHLATAARLLEEGAADIVAMTRAHLAEPAMVRRTFDGEADTVTPCVGENECLNRAFAGRQVTCVLNPMTGRERAWPMPRPAAVRPRRVTVIGAGPAGLRAAAVAGERGHEVTLLERSEEAGGHLALMARLPGRGTGARASSSSRAPRRATRARCASAWTRRRRGSPRARRTSSSSRPAPTGRPTGATPPGPARRPSTARPRPPSSMSRPRCAVRSPTRAPSAGTSSSSTRAARSCPSASPRSWLPRARAWRS